MNYPRYQFYQFLQNFRMSYGHCELCATMVQVVESHIDTSTSSKLDKNTNFI